MILAMACFGYFEPAHNFPVYVGVGERGITAIAIGDPPAGEGWRRDDRHPLVSEAARQLREYFGGQRRSFDLPLELAGTEFQRRVWAELLKIPYGETRSYSEVARAIGKPRAVRAVGSANHANPIAIVVPCHRVIAADGGLAGYGGGLDRKRLLLELEGATTARTSRRNSSGRSNSRRTSSQNRRSG